MQRSSKLLSTTAALLIIGIAVWWLTPTRAATAAREPGAPNQTKAVPVFAVPVEAKDVPIVIRGIGSVQAFNTVSVKSRVDGNIVKVAFTEGQFVHAGDLLIGLDKRALQAALDQAVANQAKDQANLTNAQRDLERDAAILPSQLAVTRQQYDTQVALVSQLQATVKSDEALVEAARVNLDYADIRSPIDGITGLRQVDIGNLVQTSSATTLVVVTQIKPIAVTFPVAGRDLTRIRQAMTDRKLQVAAFDGDDKKQIAIGNLTLVNNQVDQATGMVTLKATFANDDTVLWPGEFVVAHLVLETVENGATVPAAALQMGPAGSFVYVIKDDSTVDLRPVTVTQVEGNVALVAKGLNAGEKVVISGQRQLSAGVKVAVQEGAPGQMNSTQPEIGPEGVGSTGVNTPPAGGGGFTPR